MYINTYIKKTPIYGYGYKVLHKTLKQWKEEKIKRKKETKTGLN